MCKRLKRPSKNQNEKHRRVTSKQSYKTDKENQVEGMSEILGGKKNNRCLGDGLKIVAVKTMLQTETVPSLMWFLLEMELYHHPEKMSKTMSESRMSLKTAKTPMPQMKLQRRTKLLLLKRKRKERKKRKKEGGGGGKEKGSSKSSSKDTGQSI